MILQALHALYARLKDDPSYEVAPPGYSKQNITFKVVLHPDGRLFEIQPALVNGKPRKETVLGYSKPSGPGMNPRTLWDNTGYMLGFDPDDTDQERTQKSFEAFRKRHLAVEPEVKDEAFSAVCRFLESWDPAEASTHAVLKVTTSGFGVFQIVGESEFVHKRPTISTWWDRVFAAEQDVGDEAQCLLTGSWAPAARLHQKIKIPGGDAALVCFDKDAFCSYGKTRGDNAPVSQMAAVAYTDALNTLIGSPKHRARLAESTVVFWTDRPSLVEDVFAQFAERGSDLAPRKDEVQDATVLKEMEVFLDALRQGIEKAGDLGKDSEGTKFYLLGLSPNQGRVAVRFFHQGSVKELIEHLREHHRDIGIERQYGEGSKRPDPEFPPTWMLLRQTGREADDIPPNLSAPLLRAILTGCRYPESLLAAVIRRIRADREVGYLRASIIKGCLIRNHGKEIPMSLDTERSEPAYRLGRLFAVLERIQEVAYLRQTGQFLKQGIRDNYFSAASATPASVFPRIEKLSTHHRRQLSGGQKHHYDELIAEIKQGQSSTPAVLSLPDQGLFSLGYYHQWIALRSKNETQEANQEE